jgi:glycosyltransferase involved in cell wall biosynthesis
MVLYDHGFSSIQRPNNENRASLNSTERIICVSNANKRILRERWGYQKRIDVLPNPLRTNAGLTPPSKRRELTSRIPTIGTATRLVPVKGVATIIHAIKILKDQSNKVRLIVAGAGIEADNLLALSRRLELQEEVHFIGHQHDMTNFYGTIDILAAPSLREPFGLSVVEAVSMGVPVILSEVDGHPEAIPYKNAGIFVRPDLPLDEYLAMGVSALNIPLDVYSPSDDAIVETKAVCPKALAEAVHQCLSNYGLYSSAAFSASQRIRRDFSFERYVSEYLNLLHY